MHVMHSIVHAVADIMMTSFYRVYQLGRKHDFNSNFFEELDIKHLF